jgi:hypothetical protein
MAEIKTPPIILQEGDSFTAIDGPATVFTDDHTWADVIRWVRTEMEPAEIVIMLTEGGA